MGEGAILEISRVRRAHVVDEWRIQRIHFEHLDYPNAIDSTGWVLETATAPSEALGFLRQCRRILKPGGVLDLVVPDAEGAMHCVNYLFRQGREHKYAYDEKTLRRVLENVGFAGVLRRSFDASLDAPNHEIGSLFMRAARPS